MGQTAKNVIIAFVLLNLAVFGAVLYFQRVDRQAPEKVGGEAPAFSLPVVGSKQIISLDEQRGKVVLLDFWATWCPPCLKQMPAVQRLEEDESLEESLKIVSVNTDERGNNREERVSQFLDKHGYTFTTVIDDGRVADSYGVSRLPTLVVISPDGDLAHVESGVHSEEELRELVDSAAR